MTPTWVEPQLFGDEEREHFQRDEVLAINPTHYTNGQRVADLGRLGYLPSPCLDPTFGYGSMWTDWRPDVLIASDGDPEKSPGPAHDFTDLPWGTGEFASCLYDPPYRFAGTPTDTGERGHDDLYGTHLYRTKAEQMQLIINGARECSRVTRDFLVVKCADQVVAGSVRWQASEIAQFLSEWWVLKDRLGLLSYRPQPAGRSQKNARQNVSWFLVFVPA